MCGKTMPLPALFYQLLASFGRDYAQGFLYFPAVPENVFMRLLCNKGNY